MNGQDGAAHNGQGRPGPSALARPAAEPSPAERRKIIPLMPGVARPTGERRAVMAEAVLEVVRHLVIRAVPPQERSPLFSQAADLLGEAGWGLDELFEAAQGEPARSALLRALGLET